LEATKESMEVNVYTMTSFEAYHLYRMLDDMSKSYDLINLEGYDTGESQVSDEHGFKIIIKG